jgi:preprotein translocase subunit SecF
MYNIIGKSKIWLSISGLLMLISIVGLFMWGLKPGLDFTSGSLLDISYQPTRPTIAQVETSLQPLNLKEVKIQPSGEQNFIIRFGEVDETTHQAILNNLTAIKIGGTTATTTLTENKFETIGPVISQELKTKAAQAIVVVLILIVLYIAYAFRKVSRPVASWKYGLAAIIALVHDILVVTGVFVFLGHFAGVEIDSLFITALLTILGFSVHDTIVTFDRTRENLFKNQDKPFKEVVNLSINQTIVRSINTSLTTLIVLLAVYIFGGETTKYFSLALILGIIIGTYSSIFIASPIVVMWNKNK